MLKMFFSILILYSIGAFIISMLISAGKIRVINKHTGEETKISRIIKLFFILYWPLVLYLLVRDSKGDDR